MKNPKEKEKGIRMSILFHLYIKIFKRSFLTVESQKPKELKLHFVTKREKKKKIAGYS